MDNLNREVQELEIYLFNSPIAFLITSYVFIIKQNGAISIYFELSDIAKAIQLLIDSPVFINANLGWLHNIELGQSSFDFRSRTQGKYKFGNKSLQINIGKINGKARADLDRFNPLESFDSLIGHTLEALKLT